MVNVTYGEFGLYTRPVHGLKGQIYHGSGGVFPNLFQACPQPGGILSIFQLAFDAYEPLIRRIRNTSIFIINKSVRLKDSSDSIFALLPLESY